MSDDQANDAVTRLLLMLAERLESYLEGDETALETLGECIEQSQLGADEVQAAVMVLRSLGGAAAVAESVSIEGAPGKYAQRVPSAEERERLTPDAWGYLLGLRRSGSLDSGQFERVLDLLTTSGVRPIGVDFAREVATRVALNFDESEPTGELPHGDFDVAH
jgi:uncharacterized protein Smg (DUF494 family)